MCAAKQSTLFQTWGKKETRPTAKDKVRPSISGYSNTGGDVIELSDGEDDGEDALLARALEESLLSAKVSEIARRQCPQIAGKDSPCEPSSSHLKNEIPVPPDDDVDMYGQPSLSQIDDLPGFDKTSGRVWIYPTNYPIREYQFNIVSKALFQNTLVTLPTGLGKTFIGAVLMYNFYRWYPQGKVVFMAPTKPLVAQQIEACFNIMGIPQEDTAEMTGTMPPTERLKAWNYKRVFFLTPQVLTNDLSRGACPSADMRCLVVDEAHKALGNHAYCQVVRELVKYTREFRVLALSATPGSDIKAVQQVVANLLISHIELRSEESIDIQPYVHERKVTKIVVPLGPELSAIKEKYIRVMDVIVKRLTRQHVLYNRQTTSLSKFMILKSREAFRQNPPPEMQRSQYGVIEGDFAIAMSLYHGFELLQQHGLKSLYSYLESLVSGDKGYGRTRAELTRNGDFREIMDQLQQQFVTGAANVIQPFDLSQRQTPAQPFASGHPKMDKLREVVLEHFNKYQEQGLGSTRVMIFSQYRDSVSEIIDMLSRHRPVVKVMSFIGQSSAGKSTKGFTQKEQLKVMKKFREGGYNTLVATCVGEEGLDIGDVDLIICFDASKSPIRLVQRMGRTGRKREGNIVMLMSEGKEEQLYNQSQYSKKSIHKAILNGKRTLQFYPNSPRMVPKNLQPRCHKMHITVQKAFATTVKGRASKTGTKNQNITGLFEQAGKQSSKTDGTLNEAELKYWSEHFQLPQDQIPWLPNTTFTFFKKKGQKQAIPAGEENNPKGPMLRLSEWMPWQNRKHSTMLIDHSLRTEHLVEMMEFIDHQQMLGDEDDSYGTEMAAYLNTDLILCPNKDSTDKEGIRKFCSSTREKDLLLQNKKTKTSRLISLPSLDSDTAGSNSDEDLPTFLGNSSVQETENKTKLKSGDRKISSKLKQIKVTSSKTKALKNKGKKFKSKNKSDYDVQTSRVKQKKKRVISGGHAVVKIILDAGNDEQDFDLQTDILPVETNVIHSTTTDKLLVSKNDITEDDIPLEKYNLSQLLPNFTSYGKGLNSPSFLKSSFERSDKSIGTPDHCTYPSDHCESPSYQVLSPPPIEEVEKMFSNINNPKVFSGIDLLELVDQWEREKLFGKNKNNGKIEEDGSTAVNPQFSSLNPSKKQKVSVSKQNVCVSLLSSYSSEDCTVYKEKDNVCLEIESKGITGNLNFKENVNDIQGTQEQMSSAKRLSSPSLQGNTVVEDMEWDDSIAREAPEIPDTEKQSKCVQKVKTCTVLPQTQSHNLSSHPLVDMSTDLLDDLSETNNLGDDIVFASQGFPQVLETSEIVSKCSRSESNNVHSVTSGIDNYPESLDKMADVSMEMFEDLEIVEDYGAFDLELSDSENVDENKDGLSDRAYEKNDMVEFKDVNKDGSFQRKQVDPEMTNINNLVSCNLELVGHLENKYNCETDEDEAALPGSPVINTHLPFRAYTKPNANNTPVARVTPFSKSQITDDVAEPFFDDTDDMFLSYVKTPDSVHKRHRSIKITPGKVSKSSLDETQFTFTQALDCLGDSPAPSQNITPKAAYKGQNIQRSTDNYHKTTTPSIKIDLSGARLKSANDQLNDHDPSPSATPKSSRLEEAHTCSSRKRLQLVTPTIFTNATEFISSNDQSPDNKSFPLAIDPSNSPTFMRSNNQASTSGTGLKGDVSCDRSMALFQDSDSDSNDRPQFELEFMWDDADVIPPSPVHDQSVSHKSMSKCSQSMVFGKKRMSSIAETTSRADQDSTVFSEQNTFPFEESVIFSVPSKKQLHKMSADSMIVCGPRNTKGKPLKHPMPAYRVSANLSDEDSMAADALSTNQSERDSMVFEKFPSDSVIFHRSFHIPEKVIPEYNVLACSTTVHQGEEMEDSAVFHAPRSKKDIKKPDNSLDFDAVETSQFDFEDDLVQSTSNDCKDWDILLEDGEMTSPNRPLLDMTELPTSPVFTPVVSNARVVRVSPVEEEESSNSDDDICYKRTKKSSKIALVTSPRTPSVNNEDEVTPLKLVEFKRPQICDSEVTRNKTKTLHFSTESDDSPVMPSKRSRGVWMNKKSAARNITYNEEEEDDDFADTSISSIKPGKKERQRVSPKRSKKRPRAFCPFIENEAELSDDGASDISDDEIDCSQLDEALPGFINDCSQMTQHHGHDEEAMYLKSVKSPMLTDRDGIYRRDRPSAMEVCSQFSPPDHSEYLEDSFCVEGEEEEEEEEISDLGEISCFYPTSKRSKNQEKPSKRRCVEKKSRIVSGRKRVIVQDDSSSDDASGPNIETSMLSPDMATIKPRVRRTRVLSSSEEESVTDTHVPTTNTVTNKRSGENRQIQRSKESNVSPMLSLRSRLQQKRGSDVNCDQIQNNIEPNCDISNKSAVELSRPETCISLCLPVTVNKTIDNLYTGHAPKLKTANQLREERLRKQKEKQEQFRKTLLKKNGGDDLLKTHSIEKSEVTYTENVTECDKTESSVNNNNNFTHLSNRRSESYLPCDSSLLTTPAQGSRFNEEKKMVLFVDSREITGGQEVVSHLRVGNEFRVSVRQLTGCDYILSNRLGVERKQWSDFANGSNRSKLQERIQLMCCLFDRQCLIIEKDRVKVGQEKSTKPIVKTKFVDTILAWLSQSTVRVFYTDSQEETAILLSDLCKLESRKGMGIQLSLDLNNHQQQMLKLYTSFPYISYITALNLCHGFKNLKELSSSSVKSLQLRGHMSESSARDLKDFLQHEFCLSMVPASKQ